MDALGCSELSRNTFDYFTQIILNRNREMIQKCWLSHREGTFINSQLSISAINSQLVFPYRYQ